MLNCGTTTRSGETHRQGHSKDPKAGEIVIEKETLISARINGNKNHAMLVVGRAVEVVKEKVKKSGFAIAGTFNTKHIIRCYWLLCLPSGEGGADRVCFQPFTHRELPFLRFIRTCVWNQILWPLLFPGGEDPIVLDMSTAATSYFGLVEAQTAGRSIPADFAYDNQGNPTTDPQKSHRGRYSAPSTGAIKDQVSL